MITSITCGRDMYQLDDTTWAVEVSPLMRHNYGNLLKVIHRLKLMLSFSTPKDEMQKLRECGWRKLRVERELNGRRGCWWVLQAQVETENHGQSNNQSA